MRVACAASRSRNGTDPPARTFCSASNTTLCSWYRHAYPRKASFAAFIAPPAGYPWQRARKMARSSSTTLFRSSVDTAVWTRFYEETGSGTPIVRRKCSEQVVSLRCLCVDVGLSCVRRHRTDKIQPVDRRCHSVNRGCTVFNDADTKSAGAGSYQYRGSAVPLGGQGKRQFHRRTTFHRHVRVEVDSCARNVAELCREKFRRPMLRRAYLHRQRYFIPSCFSPFSHAPPKASIFCTVGATAQQAFRR